MSKSSVAGRHYDPATNTIRSIDDGQVLITFWPGDQGPYGVVGSNGAIYRFTGHVDSVLDADTEAFTFLTWSGRAQDICAALS